MAAAKEEDVSPSQVRLLAFADPPLQVQLLTATATIPVRATAGSVGYDLCADEKCEVAGGSSAKVRTGIAIAAPEGTYGRIAPRSGLAVKNGIDVLAGVIDRDYRGEVVVILHNTFSSLFRIEKGDRIAQLILERCACPPVVVSTTLTATARGAGGFGSTGVAKTNTKMAKDN